MDGGTRLYEYDVRQHSVRQRHLRGTLNRGGACLPAVKLCLGWYLNPDSPCVFAAKTALLSDIDELPCIHLGDFTLTFELGEMSERTKEVALNELRESPETVGPAVERLRELIAGKHLG